MKGWIYNHRSKDVLDKFTSVVDQRNEMRVKAGLSNDWTDLFQRNISNKKPCLSQKSTLSISPDNSQDIDVNNQPGTVTTNVSNMDDPMEIAEAKSQNSLNSCTSIDGVDISTVIEQLQIEFKIVKDSNVSYLEQLLEQSNYEKVISQLKKVSCNQLLGNICIAFLLISPEKLKYNQNELFYTHILLPILKTDEVNRNLEQAILERIEKYDADIFKYIFVPLMLTNEQSCILKVAVLSKINTKSKENLLIEYLRHGSVCVEAHFPSILMLYKSVSQIKKDGDITKEMIPFLLSGNDRYFKNINFGKILHAVTQNLKDTFVNIPQDSDFRKNMVKIINDNETPFKNSCKALLGLK